MSEGNEETAFEMPDTTAEEEQGAIAQAMLPTEPDTAEEQAEEEIAEPETSALPDLPPELEQQIEQQNETTSLNGADAVQAETEGGEKKRPREDEGLIGDIQDEYEAKRSKPDMNVIRVWSTSRTKTFDVPVSEIQQTKGSEGYFFGLGRGPKAPFRLPCTRYLKNMCDKGAGCNFIHVKPEIGNQMLDGEPAPEDKPPRNVEGYFQQQQQIAHQGGAMVRQQQPNKPSFVQRPFQLRTFKRADPRMDAQQSPKNDLCPQLLKLLRSGGQTDIKGLDCTCPKAHHPSELVPAPAHVLLTEEQYPSLTIKAMFGGERSGDLRVFEYSPAQCFFTGGISDILADPTQNGRIRICRHFMKWQACELWDRCKFIHILDCSPEDPIIHPLQEPYLPRPLRMNRAKNIMCEGWKAAFKAYQIKDFTCNCDNAHGAEELVAPNTHVLYPPGGTFVVHDIKQPTANNYPSEQVYVTKISNQYLLQQLTIGKQQRVSHCYQFLKYQKCPLWDQCNFMHVKDMERQPGQIAPRIETAPQQLMGPQGRGVVAQPQLRVVQQPGLGGLVGVGGHPMIINNLGMAGPAVGGVSVTQQGVLFGQHPQMVQQALPRPQPTQLSPQLQQQIQILSEAMPPCNSIVEIRKRLALDDNTRGQVWPRTKFCLAFNENIGDGSAGACKCPHAHMWAELETPPTHIPCPPTKTQISVKSNEAEQTAHEYPSDQIYFTGGLSQYIDMLRSGATPVGLHCNMFLRNRKCRHWDSCRFMHVASRRIPQPESKGVVLATPQPPVAGVIKQEKPASTAINPKTSLCPRWKQGQSDCNCALAHGYPELVEPPDHVLLGNVGTLNVCSQAYPVPQTYNGIQVYRTLGAQHVLQGVVECGTHCSNYLRHSKCELWSNCPDIHVYRPPQGEHK